MVNKNDFLGKKYDDFKEETEKLIKKYESGGYKTDLKETKFKISAINIISGRKPQDFLPICNLYKFVQDVYSTSYVKNICEFAKEKGLNLDFPHEFNYDMDTFALVKLKNPKWQKYINTNFELTFSKTEKKADNTFLSTGATIRIIKIENGKLVVSKTQEILQGINRIDAI
jgi:hypothetical protein